MSLSQRFRFGQGIAIGLAQTGADVACFHLPTSVGLDEGTPRSRIAGVEDMVGPAVFLASAASAFCTDTDLIVDGGFVCW